MLLSTNVVKLYPMAQDIIVWLEGDVTFAVGTSDRGRCTLGTDRAHKISLDEIMYASDDGTAITLIDEEKLVVLTCLGDLH